MYREEFAVRNNEIDSLGHVNNSAYFIYFEHTRNMFLSEIGFNIFKMQEKGVGLVIYESKVKYIMPILPNDRITVELDVIMKSKLKYVFFECIKRNIDGKVMATGKFKATSINAETNRPVWVPEFKEYFGKKEND